MEQGRTLSGTVTSLLASTLFVLALGSCTDVGAWDRLSAMEAMLDEARLPTKRMSVDIGPFGQADELNNFPVLVRLPADFPYDQCAPNGLDIEFRTEDGLTLLDWELESWRPGQTSVFWVKLPVLPANPSSTRIWLYYGADFPLDRSNPEAVWSNGYEAVWHGIVDTVDGSLRYRDSTGRHHGFSNDGTLTPPELIEGPIGRAFSYTGDSECGIAVNATGALNDIGTFQLDFVIRDRSSTFSDRYLLSRDNFILGIKNGRAPFLSIDFFGGTLEVNGPTLWDPTTWTYASISWDQSQVVFWGGDSQRGSFPATGSGTQEAWTEQTWVIGNSSPPPSKLEADLDEIRLSRIVRSSAWMLAEYKSQEGADVSFGTPEDVVYD